MRNFYLLAIALLALQFSALAQSYQVSGYVHESGTNRPLPDVIISEDGTKNSTLTDQNGSFVMQLKSDTAKIVFSIIGYSSITFDAKSMPDTIELVQTSKELSLVIISSQLSIKRETPIASSVVYANKIEEKLGTQEFPEILKQTPSVHPNAQGGGWGDSEIFMRGFGRDRVAILVNGIPVNNMETNDLYWSNWAGLSEVASMLQVQRGVGYSKLASPSIGGTINIITKGLDSEKGGSLSLSLGHDKYRKLAFSVNSGLTKKGWAFTIYGSYTKGDGYVQGTDFNVYNYYVNLTKKINDKHLLNFRVFGAPQKHHMRSNALTQSEWDKVRLLYAGKDWTRYNPDYGFNDVGIRKSADYNVYQEPQLQLNHIWRINEKSSLNTTLYASFARGYGYDGRTNSDTYYDSDWYGAMDGILNTTFRRDDGTFDYCAIEAINAASTNGSEMIMTKQIGNTDKYGLVSLYETSLGKYFKLDAGIDIRYFNGVHRNEISDLFGGDYYIDPSRDDVSADNNTNASDEAWVNQHLGVGDVVYRDYDANIMQEGVFTQLGFTKNRLFAFVSGAINYSTYWRFDRLYYDANNARSKNISFWGGNVKAGTNYNIGKHHNVFFNIGYMSLAPRFKSGAFMSANTSNLINTNVKNEKAFSTEIGYGFDYKFIRMNLGGYYTKWIDKSMTKKGKMSNKEQYYMNMTGVDARHMGIEVELEASPTKWMDIQAMFSIGDWVWDSDSVKGYAYDISGNAISPEGNITTPGAEDHAWAIINIKGVKVGGSAQTTAALGVVFKPFKGLRLSADYTLYARNYAYYTLSGGNLSLGKIMNVSDPWKIPISGSLDAYASYTFPVGRFSATILGQVNNVLNQKNVEKAWNPSNVGETEIVADESNVYMFYSAGRTWCVTLKFNF